MHTSSEAVAATAPTDNLLRSRQMLAATATAALIALAAPQGFAASDGKTGASAGDSAAASTSSGATVAGSDAETMRKNDAAGDGGSADTATADASPSAGDEPLQGDVRNTLDKAIGAGGGTQGATGTEGGSATANAERPADDAKRRNTAEADEAKRLDRDNAGRTVMLDVEGFTEKVYERGFRQGYVRGIADARERLAQEMRMQQMRLQDRAERSRQGMPGEMQQQSRDSARNDGGADRAPGRERISGEVASRGGSIIVLPEGVSPEAFIQRLVERNQGRTQQGG